MIRNPKHEDYADGYILLVDGAKIGVGGVDIVDNRLLIDKLYLDTDEFGDNTGKGYGTVFLTIREEYAKEQGFISISPNG